MNVSTVCAGGVIVRALDLQPIGHMFVPLRVTTMGKLFTHMCPCHQAV